MFPLPFQYLGSGSILFAAPTYITAGGAVPVDVWVLLPLNQGSLVTTFPADTAGPTPNYAGTSHTQEGLTDTLLITVSEWRDPANATPMNAYASDVLDSVKDARVEGTVTYHGLFSPALTMGNALTIAATPYGTPYGWSGMSIPILETELEWTGSMLHTTRMRVSNRREHYSVGAFLHPNRTGITWGPPPGAEGLTGMAAAARALAIARDPAAAAAAMAAESITRSLGETAKSAESARGASVFAQRAAMEPAGGNGEAAGEGAGDGGGEDFGGAGFGGGAFGGEATHRPGARSERQKAAIQRDRATHLAGVQRTRQERADRAERIKAAREEQDAQRRAEVQGRIAERPAEAPIPPLNMGE
jgi:hypothetical protein